MVSCEDEFAISWILFMTRDEPIPLLVLGIGTDAVVKDYTFTPQMCQYRLRYEKAGFGFMHLCFI